MCLTKTRDSTAIAGRLDSNTKLQAGEIIINGHKQALAYGTSVRGTFFMAVWFCFEYYICLLTKRLLKKKTRRIMYSWLFLNKHFGNQYLLKWLFLKSIYWKQKIIKLFFFGKMVLNHISIINIDENYIAHDDVTTIVVGCLITYEEE